MTEGRALEINDAWALECVEKAGRGEKLTEAEAVAAYVYELGWRDGCRDADALSPSCESHAKGVKSAEEKEPL